MTDDGRDPTGSPGDDDVDVEEVRGPPPRLRAVFSAVRRAGSWRMPPEVEVQVLCGSMELDLRDAMLGPGTTTMCLNVTMGSLEVVVPTDVAVEVEVEVVAGHVDEPRRHPVARGGPVLRLIGNVRLGSCEVFALRPDGERDDGRREDPDRVDPNHGPYRGDDLRGGEVDAWDDHGPGRRRRHHARHARHAHWRARKRAHREAWRRSHQGRSRWHPWWLLARMRRRIFVALALAAGGGAYLASRLDHAPRWWWIVLGLVGLFMISGAFAWRLTRPLIMTIGAARDIGDGKLETRIDPRAHGGEVRLLATAINDMAEKIQQQLADQRQLLAAVSHELRTPLGHMRVLIETARDHDDPKALGELEREVLVLDDLVGRLLASSRLEFGSIERRDVDIVELVGDAASAAGVDATLVDVPEAIRASIDPTLVRRATANLLDNARIHGGGAVAVRVARRPNQIVIEVDDDGPGVPPDRRADAFRAFVPSSGGGLGLGLALVSRIAVAHGGGAWIEDRPGGGARVGFSLAV